MKIRSGTYTVYNGIEMSVSEPYGHGLNQELAEKHRVLSYPSNLDQMPGFELDTDTDTYRKDVPISDLINAFVITTKLTFRDEEFDVWSFNPEKNYFTVFTFDHSLGEKFKFIKLSDRFIQEIGMKDVTKVWEERTQSALNLPFPPNLETILELTNFV